MMLATASIARALSFHSVASHALQVAPAIQRCLHHFHELERPHVFIPGFSANTFSIPPPHLAHLGGPLYHRFAELDCPDIGESAANAAGKVDFVEHCFRAKCVLTTQVIPHGRAETIHEFLP